MNMCPECDIELVNKEMVDGKELLKCGRCGAYYEECTFNPMEW